MTVCCSGVRRRNVYDGTCSLISDKMAKNIKFHIIRRALERLTQFFIFAQLKTFSATYKDIRDAWSNSRTWRKSVANGIDYKWMWNRSKYWFHVEKCWHWQHPRPLRFHRALSHAMNHSEESVNHFSSTARNSMPKRIFRLTKEPFFLFFSIKPSATQHHPMNSWWRESSCFNVRIKSPQHRRIQPSSLSETSFVFFFGLFWVWSKVSFSSSCIVEHLTVIIKG